MNFNGWLAVYGTPDKLLSFFHSFIHLKIWVVFSSVSISRTLKLGVSNYLVILVLLQETSNVNCLLQTANYATNMWLVNHCLQTFWFWIAKSNKFMQNLAPLFIPLNKADYLIGATLVCLVSYFCKTRKDYKPSFVFVQTYLSGLKVNLLSVLWTLF